MSEIGRYLVCQCGWYDRPSFGDRWFSEKSYPVCPRCGRDTDEAEMRTGRVVGVFRRRFVPMEAGT